MAAFFCDDEGFGTGADRIPWTELVAVGIRTTSGGPFDEDVFWQFLLREGIVEVPGLAVGSRELGELQRRLPGLDSLKIIRAMGSTEERIFRVWHFEESPGVPDEEALAARFLALVRRLGGPATGAQDVFPRLLAAWDSGSRSYHNREHLADCLRELDRAAAAREVADVAELALWYHDALCAPGARGNEERSAQLLRTDATALGVDRATAEAAAQCIRATAHEDQPVPPGDPARDLVLDIDLSILGRDVLRFMDYEYSIAEEYSALRAFRFFAGRRRFLASVLASPRIYRTELFRDRYEAAARNQIAALLRSPRYESPWKRWLFGRG